MQAEPPTGMHVHPGTAHSGPSTGYTQAAGPQPGGSTRSIAAPGMQPYAPGLTAYAGAPSAPRAAAPRGAVTGAYMPSGDPAIDRMVALERALKQYGSPV